MDTSPDAQWRQSLPQPLKPAPIELLAVSVLMALAGAFLLVVVLIALPDLFRMLILGQFGRWIGIALLMVCVALVAIAAPCFWLAWRIAHADRVARGLSYVLLGSLAGALLIANDHGIWLTISLIACLGAIGVLAASPNVRAYFLERGSDGAEPTPVVIARLLVLWWAALVGALGVLSLGLIDADAKIALAGLIYIAAAAVAFVFNKRLLAGDPLARVVVAALPLGLVVAGIVFGSRSLAVVEPIAVSIGLACFLWLPPSSREYFDNAATSYVPPTRTRPPARPFGGWLCPRCHAPMKPEWRHCSACGLDMAPPVPPQAPAPQPFAAQAPAPQPPAPQPPAPQPPAPQPPAPQPPVPRQPVPTAPTPLGLPWTLVLDSGDAVDVDGLVLIGSDPAASYGEKPDHLVIVDDAGGSVAPTHLACGLAADGFWVADRGSVTGVSVEGAAGARQRCAPGVRTRVEAGAKVYFGDRWFVAPGGLRAARASSAASSDGLDELDEVDDLERTRRRPSMPG